jgi:hypothetical protein
MSKEEKRELLARFLSMLAEMEANWTKRRAEIDADWEKRRLEVEAEWEKRCARREAAMAKLETEWAGLMATTAAELRAAHADLVRWRQHNAAEAAEPDPRARPLQ